MFSLLICKQQEYRLPPQRSVNNLYLPVLSVPNLRTTVPEPTVLGDR